MALPRAPLEELGFRVEPEGANVWLILPNDEGVFQGADEQEGIGCVHPVQVYVDLKDLPERAPEAAKLLGVRPNTLRDKMKRHGLPW